MEISAVKCLLLSAPYATSSDDERTLHLRTGYRSASIIKVETGDGLYGLGEVYSGVYAPEVVAALVAQLEDAAIGQDSTRISAIWDRLRLASYYWGRFGIVQSVIGGIEMALWDLLGKRLELPVHALLGGRVHDALPAYASGGNNKPTDQLKEEMRSHVCDGFRAVKIRINNLPDLDSIVNKVESCREALGSEIGLAVDAAQGLDSNPWTAKQAITVARAIEHCKPLWLEEPTEVSDYKAFAEIRRSVLIPIAGGETVTSLIEAEAYLQAGAVDLFQPDASLIGGISVVKKVADLCQRRQVPIAIHAWCSGVGIMGNFHVAFASPNCTYLELPSVPNPLRDGLLKEPLQLEDGQIRAPMLPGLGVDLPDQVREKYLYRAGSYYRILGASERN